MEQEQHEALDSAAASQDPSQVDAESWREAVTMALYVSLSLQAVLLATPVPDAGDEASGAALRVFLTALGLLVAHQVAFRLSTRLTHGGLVADEARSLLRAQLVGGLPVAFVAALPVLILGSQGLAVAEALLLLFVGSVGFLAARAAGATRARAAAYVLVIMVVIAGVLALKLFVKH